MNTLENKIFDLRLGYIWTADKDLGGVSGLFNFVLAYVIIHTIAMISITFLRYWNHKIII